MRKFNYIILALLLTLVFSCKTKKTEDCESLTLPVQSNKSYCETWNMVQLRAEIKNRAFFNNTIPIEIPSYNIPTPKNLIDQYGYVMTLNGDSSVTKILSSTNCCEIFNGIDKLSREPSFEWNSVPSSLVAIGIFKEKVVSSSDGKRIANVNDIIWTWNSGMNTGAKSGGKTSINYSDGKDVTNGIIESGATPLEINRKYYWMVWAWDQTGRRIEYSSKVIPFISQPELVRKIEVLGRAIGFWQLGSARISDSKVDLTKTFPIQSIKIQYTCNENFFNPISVEITGPSTNPNKQVLTAEYSGKFVLDQISFSGLIRLCNDSIVGKATVEGTDVDVVFY